ncbi:MAG: hypothetical protein R2932_28065 [Caldilineaceae bacterium]
MNNFYAALTWTLEEGGDATLGLRLAGLLGRLWGGQLDGKKDGNGSNGRC